MTEGEQRKWWRRWRKQKWDADRSWDTETGAEGDVRTWEIVHISFLELLALKSLSHGKLKWQTRLVQKNKSVCWKNEGKTQKMREREDETLSETFTCSPFSSLCRADFKCIYFFTAADNNTSAQALSEPAAVTYQVRRPLFTKYADDIKWRNIEIFWSSSFLKIFPCDLQLGVSQI